jgi:hypothetical protein
MNHRFSTLFLICLTCIVGLLGTTYAWAQAPSPATLNNGSSLTYCSFEFETGFLASCPAGTSLVASSTQGVLTIEPSALFPADPTRILPPLSPLGLTTYTIVCTNSSGSSSPVTVDVTIIQSPASPIVTYSPASRSSSEGTAIMLTATCEPGAQSSWDNNPPSAIQFTPTTPPGEYSYLVSCQGTATGCYSNDTPASATIVAASPFSPTLTFGNSATFCVPTESCGGVFLYNSVVCPVGWLFSYRDPGGLLINTNAQSGPIEIPYAPSKPPQPLRILNYTVMCTNPLTGQTTSTLLTIYVDNAPLPASLWIVTKP